MLVGLCPNPFRSASVRCRLRICAKHFYNKKNSLGLFHKWEESSAVFVYRVCIFSCAALFFCKEQFYIFLCTNQFLHFIRALR